jgi:SAM-dependent methyltransferase
MQAPVASYTNNFFDETQITAESSASIVVPMVLELLPINSVVDIGCGTGSWLAHFHENGVNRIKGVDSSGVNYAKLRVPADCVEQVDISKSFELNESFDLAACLEVAEHLPSNCANNLVDSLTKLAPVILFSAAIPFQGGTHHVNEQWPEYWAQLFAERGYVVIDCFRQRIWRNENVAYWYSQNLLLYVHKDKLAELPQLIPFLNSTDPAHLSFIHPKQYLKSRDELSSPKYMFMRLAWNLLPRPIRLRLVKPLAPVLWRRYGSKY